MVHQPIVQIGLGVSGASHGFAANLPISASQMHPVNLLCPMCMLAFRLACAILPCILPCTDAIAATTKTTRLSCSKQTNVLKASAEL